MRYLSFVSRFAFVAWIRQMKSCCHSIEFFPFKWSFFSPMAFTTCENQQLMFAQYHLRAMIRRSPCLLMAPWRRPVVCLTAGCLLLTEPSAVWCRYFVFCFFFVFVFYVFLYYYYICLLIYIDVFFDFIYVYCSLFVSVFSSACIH